MLNMYSKSQMNLYGITTKKAEVNNLGYFFLTII